ncbi:MAG: hypothetical protein LBU32_27250 [Clostridiales bacterium]|jgi:hypothetical protein|nr:hypothetical protein [Clostridiales bacterium]
MINLHIRHRLYAFTIALVMALAMAGCSNDDAVSPANKKAPAFAEDDDYDDYDEDDDYDDYDYDYDEDDDYDYASGESWAVYWYLCGSDLESSYGFASGDLEEMREVDLTENVTVVIQAGGSNEWENGFDPDVLTRCVYDANGFEIVEETPSASMGETETLADFLNFCNDNYPADNRAVILWNHGSGSVYGVGFDELYGNDSLILPEIYEAFSAADFDGKYELIGFDACLMATIDVANTLSDFANWMVASEELEPGCGWDYEGMLEALADDPGMSGAELGVAICDTYFAGCEALGYAEDVTLSVVDLSAIPALVSAYDAVGCEALLAMAMSPQDYMGAFGRAAHAAENYGGNSKSEGYTNMVDLGDLVRQSSGYELLPMSENAVLQALDAAVYYKVNGSLRSRASGLSCYYSYDGDYDSYSDFANLAVSPAFSYYYDYILSGSPSDEMYDYALSNAPDFSSESIDPEELNPQELVRPDADSLEDYPVTVTDDGVAVLDLGAEIADQLVGVYFDLAYIDEESGMMIFLGMDNDLDADWDNGVFMDNFRGVWGGIGGALVYMELTDVAEGYQTYAVPILLNGEEYTLSVSYLFDTEEYRILGARRGIDENGMADKNIRPLLPGDIVEPLLYVIYDMESDEDAVPVAVESITVAADAVFEEIGLGDGSFLFLFEMVDIQNNSYLSEAVFIDVVDGEIYLS